MSEAWTFDRIRWLSPMQYMARRKVMRKEFAQPSPFVPFFSFMAKKNTYGVPQYFSSETRGKGRVITGSSNFTEAGLVDNLEFNVELKNRSDYGLSLWRNPC
jgi:phosphatidylserine/phosphatidylglycerophosphate/cardiolipin synthase-like enzyme